MRLHHLPLAVAALAVLTLAGCTAEAVTPPTASPPRTVTASPTTTADAPVVAPTTTSAAPSASSTATGCPSNGAAAPADAQSAIDGDLDGDGRDDRVFYSPGSAEFGIVTASGAVLTVRDGLAGPGRHSGWAARIAGGAVVMAIADGRGAQLFSLQRAGGACAIRPVENAQGDQYRFDQERLRGTGTGVGCRVQDGSLQLGGYDARPTGSGSGPYRVTFTRVVVSPDGRTATNGPTTVVDPAAASTSATLRIARDSTCASVPIVGSSGE